MAQPAIQAYRSLLRQLRALEPAPLRRKLLYNARALWEAHRGEGDPTRLAALYEEAAAAERVARWLQSLPREHAEPLLRHFRPGRQ